jgi:periplasmic protein TonB
VSLFFPDVYSESSGFNSYVAGIVSAIFIHAAIIAVVAYGFDQSGELSEVARPLAVRLVEAVQPVKKPEAVRPPTMNRQHRIQQPKTQPKIQPKAQPVAQPKPRPKAQPVAQPEIIKLADRVDSSPRVEKSPVTPEQAPAVSVTEASVKAVEPLVEARFDADYLSNPKPRYPLASRRLNEAGTVYLRVHVGSDGHANQVELKTSSGFHRLDQSALKTVAEWRFVPARRGSKTVASWVIVPIVFTLT